MKLAALVLTVSVGADAAELTIERADPAFFEITLAELRFSPEQPRINVRATARTIRQVLSQLGLNVHDYDLHLYDEYGMPFEVDVSSVAEEQREQSKSGPVLHYFRKNLQHIPGFGWEDGYRQDRGEIILGVTSQWPSGKHHGSVTFGVGSDWFRTFCSVKGVGVCSDREDCIGHEMGHLFGLEHHRHDWWGWAPQPKHIRYIRGLASCTHVDSWQEEREEGWKAGSSAVPVPDNWTATHDDTLK